MSKYKLQHLLKLKMQKTNNLIFFSHLRRSGGHAVMHFIHRLYDVPKLLVHNINIGAGSPNRSEFNPDWNEYKILKQQNLCLITYEDHNLENSFWNRIKFRKQVIGEYKNFYHIISLRDPYNMMASRWTWHGKYKNLKGAENVIKVWKLHAKEFINPSLPFLVAVNYNEWYQSQEYRRQLAEQLGQTFKDDNWFQTSADGQGSSFTGLIEKDARRLDVLNRWKTVTKVPELKFVFQDEELRHLSEQIFGNIIP